MSKRARYLPIAVLLMIGAGLCVSLLVVVNNPSFTFVPTQTPAVVYVPVYPSETPVPTRLPNQCTSVGGAYQIQYADAGGPYRTTGTASTNVVRSPDGRARAYVELANVYLERPDGTVVTLDDSGLFIDTLEYFAFWSPDGRYLAYGPADEQALYVIEAEAGDPRRIADMDYRAGFLGWSPDGRYLAMQQHFLRDIGIWTPTGEQTYGSDAGRDLVIDQPVIWSPDGDWLIYRWRDNSQQGSGGRSPYGFTLAAADGSAAQDVVITGADAALEPIRQLFAWSPDSRFFALTYLQNDADAYRETVRIYDLTGHALGETVSHIAPQVYSEMLLWVRDWNGIHWIANHRLVYTRPIPDDLFELLIFDLNRQTFETAYAGLARPPYYPPSGTGGAVYLGQERPYSINLLVEDETGLPFIQQASDAGDPDWLPDGDWVAAVWATGERDSRRLFLSWMRPDGSGRQDIDAGFRDVRDLRWLANSSRLAYVAWRGDEASIEIADIATGERQTIASGYSQVDRFTYDADADTLSFWWRTADGSAGKDVYHTGGERLYRLAYPGDVPLPKAEFWSPDGAVVALKVAPQTWTNTRDESLVLAYTDGRPPVIVRRNLTGLGDPFWSPDGQRLVFTQSRDSRPVSLQVVDSTGADVWDYTPFTIHRVLTWEECG